LPTRRAFCINAEGLPHLPRIVCHHNDPRDGEFDADQVNCLNVATIDATNEELLGSRTPKLVRQVFRQLGQHVPQQASAWNQEPDLNQMVSEGNRRPVFNPDGSVHVTQGHTRRNVRIAAPLRVAQITRDTARIQREARVREAERIARGQTAIANVQC
jgi:hypothetical protein